jgi:hypothetical protein
MSVVPARSQEEDSRYASPDAASLRQEPRSRRWPRSSALSLSPLLPPPRRPRWWSARSTAAAATAAPPSRTTSSSSPTGQQRGQCEWLVRPVRAVEWHIRLAGHAPDRIAGRQRPVPDRGGRRLWRYRRPAASTGRRLDQHVSDHRHGRPRRQRNGPDLPERGRVCCRLRHHRPDRLRHGRDPRGNR